MLYTVVLEKYTVAVICIQSGFGALVVEGGDVQEERGAGVFGGWRQSQEFP
jgi:hypothetical protein